MVRPTASAKAPLPSASIVSASPALAFLLHAPITKATLTAVQTISSTPFALRSAALSTKPGRCLAEQVGVQAPGTEKSATWGEEERRVGKACVSTCRTRWEAYP